LVAVDDRPAACGPKSPKLLCDQLLLFDDGIVSSNDLPEIDQQVFVAVGNA
jgi:hypothetical protein